MQDAGVHLLSSTNQSKRATLGKSSRNINEKLQNNNNDEDGNDDDSDAMNDGCNK